MRDRIPAPGRENRIRITQDDGTIIAGKLEYDDQATQEGSPYTKGNVLPDEVCTAYDLDTNIAEPKDAFLAVPGIMGKALLTITVTRITGAAYPNVTVNGLTGIDAARRKTNSNGQVVVYVDAGTYNLTFTPSPVCVDTSIPSKSITVAAGGIANITTQEVSNGLTSLDITSTRTIAFSANIQNLDAFLVGGGGAGGGRAENGQACCGGGGGYTLTRKNISISRYTAYSLIIGAGATGGTNNGGTGGSTSAFGASVSGGTGGKQLARNTTEKLGGDGGSGGGSSFFQNDGAVWRPQKGGEDGSDGKGTNPGSGQGTTTRAFGESSGALFAGGGGCGAASATILNNGGSGGGGGGGWAMHENGYDGTANTGGGGGGAGDAQGAIAGGSGGSGIIKLRWVNVS